MILYIHGSTSSHNQSRRVPYPNPYPASSVPSRGECGDFAGQASHGGHNVQSRQQICLAFQPQPELLVAVQPDIDSRKLCSSAYGPNMECSDPVRLVNTAWLWAVDVKRLC
jgi:hypothetical protein